MNKNEIELKNNTIIHKDNSLNRLDLSFLKHIELNEYKKSDLLAYWINDFAEYHDEERTFNIAKSGMYSRGDVIKVNLGFYVGNELGGLEKIEDVPINIQNIIEKEQKYIEKMEHEIFKMKKDSIALINQITTISKQRIFKDTVRRNVKISTNSLDLIDKQIFKFFTK